MTKALTVTKTNDKLTELFDEIIGEVHLNQQSKKVLFGLVPNKPLHAGFDRLIFYLKTLVDLDYSCIFVLDDFDLPKTEEIELIIMYNKELIKNLGLTNVEFVRTSILRRKTEYLDCFQEVCKIFNLKNINKSTAQLNLKNPSVSELLHSVYQTTDTIFFSANAVFGDLGQRRIYMQTRGIFKKLKRESPTCFFVTLGKDTQNLPLNKSTSRSRISYHESSNSLKKKISSSLITTENIRTSFIEEILKFSVFPYTSSLEINNFNYASTQDICTAFKENQISEGQIKEAVILFLNSRFENLKNKMSKSLTSWIDTSKIEA